MKKATRKRTKYTDEPLGNIRVVDDFLPPPEELAFKEETTKVTIGLSKSSVEFFKREAKKHGTQYQKMIRRLLDLYVVQHQGPGHTRTSSRR
jgi:predicted DNA binding CopG/RHH family protein